MLLPEAHLFFVPGTRHSSRPVYRLLRSTIVSGATILPHGGTLVNRWATDKERAKWTAEIKTLGGYDTRDTGKLQTL